MTWTQTCFCPISSLNLCCQKRWTSPKVQYYRTKSNFILSSIATRSLKPFRITDVWLGNPTRFDGNSQRWQRWRLSIFRTGSNNHLLSNLNHPSRGIVHGFTIMSAMKVLKSNVECRQDSRRRVPQVSPCTWTLKETCPTNLNSRGVSSPLLPLILWLPRTSVRPLNRTCWISNIC